MSRPPRDYGAYGLRVRSPFAVAPCTTPLAGPPGGEPDVTVRIGTTPAALPAPVDKGAFWEAAPGACLITVPGCARFLITGGRDVLVEPRGGNDHDVGVQLTPLVFTTVLQQRGVITFHACAVETGAGAVLFAGRSGSGKSSLLAALVERGYAMLADDAAGVAPASNGRPVALPALPRLKLWADTLDALAWRGRARGKVREEMEKYLVPEERFRNEPQVVRAVCILESRRQEGIEVEALPVAAAFRQLWAHTYYKRRLHGLGQQPAHFRTLTAMVERLPIMKVTRPAHPFLLDALADRIEKTLASA